MSDTLLTIKESADYLKLHWQTVRKYIKNGQINAIKVGRSIRIKESELKNHLNKIEKPEEHEIEIRFAVKDFRRIERKLLDLGAIVTYHSHVIDHWFVPNDIKNIEEKNEWFDSAVGYGLRIREQDNGYTGKIISSLEVKRLFEPHNHANCVEGEIDVANYDETAKLLKLMNFKEFHTVDKERLIYKYKGCNVVIDKLKDYLTAVEVEKVTSESPQNTVKFLRKIAEEIGLDVNREIVDKSVTYMAMEKFAKF
ncbi:MAG TPA: excisionase family DNA-binding protein [Candidatus Dojkabacteria bacterium]|nr:excisionase family DNA-binding protein [Candidatus Dojkabacteria bacterium]HQF37093.1 excisionase family DNA-binding protein [Candidatus Dojkabacteria bacterium]